jgi:CheY-like chemotaxis protein
MEAKKHILVVDDDIELAHLLAQAVSDVSNAYDVRVARDVDDAMVLVHKAQTSQQPFDLVITDIKMVGLSGLELLEALVSIAPETRTITMTAYNSPDLAQRAQDLNVYAYLTKPFILSEFRQIVHGALYPGPAEPGAQSIEPTPQLSVSQQLAIGKHLASLRVMTGTSACLLLHTSGRVLAIDPSGNDLDADDLCAALINSQDAIAQQMSQIFDQETQIKQSYFGTDMYNVCTYRLDDDHVVAVLFGPEVKEGQVWYYMREAARDLQDALAAEAEPSGAEKTRKTGDVFDMLDRFFPNRRTLRIGRQRAERRAAAEQASPLPEEVQPEPAPKNNSEPQAAPAAASSSRGSIDQDASPDAGRNGDVTGADPGTGVISLEEAQERGLFNLEAIETTRPEEPDTPEPELEVDPLPLDDIDWDVDTDTDWEEFIADADPGLGGISFEEAQKRGLIDDLQAE